MSRHWASTKEAGALRGMRFMIWLNSTVGRVAFDVVLVFVMAYFFLRRGEARRASLEYLDRVRRCYPEAVGGDSRLWLSYKHFFIFGQSLLDKYLAWAETPDGIRMEPEEEKRLFDFVETRRGCLLIGSHFGNLEYSRGIAHRHPEVTINVLIYDQHAQKFAALLAQGDPDSRMNLIQVTDVDLNLALKLKEKVQRGEWVVIAGDRVPVGDSERVAEADFIGDAARFPIGPYVLATLLQCPVFLIHCFRLDGDYRLVYEFFAEEIGADRKSRKQDYKNSAQKFATALEEQVIRAPLQWFKFFEFWGRSDAPRKGASESSMATADFNNGITASETMRVAFHDVDPAAVVWHGRYFKYFEEVRRTLLEKLDYSYQSMMDSGYVWPIVDASVRYVRPLELDQRFTVTACIVEWELRLVLEYRIHGEDGTLYTKARTVQVPVDATTREMLIGSPNILIERIEKHLQSSSQE